MILYKWTLANVLQRLPDNGSLKVASKSLFRRGDELER